jgi:hypothetical protein
LAMLIFESSPRSVYPSSVRDERPPPARFAATGRPGPARFGAVGVVC